jgi:hypothetical protein
MKTKLLENFHKYKTKQMRLYANDIKGSGDIFFQSALCGVRALKARRWYLGRHLAELSRATAAIRFAGTAHK